MFYHSNNVTILVMAFHHPLSTDMCSMMQSTLSDHSQAMTHGHGFQLSHVPSGCFQSMILVGGWGLRETVSCVIILCHTNCLNFVLNSGHQPRALTSGQVPSGPAVPFLMNWAIVRANCFYPSALRSKVWLWSLPFQNGSFANCFSSSGDCSWALHTEGWGAGSLGQTIGKIPHSSPSLDKESLKWFSPLIQKSAPRWLAVSTSGHRKGCHCIISLSSHPFTNNALTPAVTMASNDSTCHTPGHSYPSQTICVFLNMLKAFLFLVCCLLLPPFSSTNAFSSISTHKCCPSFRSTQNHPPPNSAFPGYLNWRPQNNEFSFFLPVASASFTTFPRPPWVVNQVVFQGGATWSESQLTMFWLCGLRECIYPFWISSVKWGWW